MTKLPNALLRMITMIATIWVLMGLKSSPSTSHLLERLRKIENYYSVLPGQAGGGEAEPF